jgi:hypothetical protein
MMAEYPTILALMTRCQQCGQELVLSWDAYHPPSFPVTKQCSCGAVFAFSYRMRIETHTPWVCANCLAEIPFGVPHDMGACPPAPPHLRAYVLRD